MFIRKAVFTLAACLLALPLCAADDRPAVSKTDTVKVKGTIEAIDQTRHTVTLREKDGDLVTVYASPDIKGFDDLNVGDKVTFRYTEPVVLGMHEAADRDHDRDHDRSDRTGTTSDTMGDQPPTEAVPGIPTKEPGAPGGGAGAGAASPSGTTTGSAGPGEEIPEGTMARQVTDTVTVKEIDHKDHTITFETEDGRTVTARLGDRNLPRDIDPGDRVEVTWTNAMLVSVEG